MDWFDGYPNTYVFDCCLMVRVTVCGSGENVKSLQENAKLQTVPKHEIVRKSGKYFSLRFCAKNWKCHQSQDSARNYENYRLRYRDCLCINWMKQYYSSVGTKKREHLLVLFTTKDERHLGAIFWLTNSPGEIFKCENLAAKCGEVHFWFVLHAGKL